MVLHRPFMEGSMKRCSRGDKCVHPNGPNLPVSEFAKNKCKLDGLQATCRCCISKSRREHRAANKELYRVRRHDFYTSHPGYFRTARLNKWQDVPGRGITAKQWEDIKAEFDNRCAYCSKPDDALTMDHIVPLIKGGRHDVDNVVPACQKCNDSKGSKTMVIWAATR